MTAIFMKAILSIFITILVLLSLCLAIYWCMLFVSIIAGLLGFNGVSSYFSKKAFLVINRIKKTIKIIFRR